MPAVPSAYCGRLAPRADHPAVIASSAAAAARRLAESYSACGVDAAFEIDLPSAHTAAAVTRVLHSQDFPPALVRAWCRRLGA